MLNDIERMIELLLADYRGWCDGEHIGIGPFHEQQYAVAQTFVHNAQRTFSIGKLYRLDQSMSAHGCNAAQLCRP